MPRIRTLKPEILEDAETAGLSDAGYRLFIALIVLADDHGNVRADSRWLQGQVWWAHREPPKVAEILRELSDAELIGVYTVRGQVYATVSGWTKHQRIDNASKPRVPIYNDPEAQPFQFCEGNSAKDSSEIRGEIPRNSAGPRPPTTDHDQDPEGDPAAGRGVKPKRSRKCPLPSDWEPNATAIEKAWTLGVNVAREAETFRDHHTAKGSTFLDWHAAFRTWLGNAQRFGRSGSYATKNNPTETALEGLREAEERERTGGSRSLGLFDGLPHPAEAAS